MENLILKLNAIAPLGLALENAIKERLKKTHLLKKDFLVKEGQISKKIYFLEKGTCRAFYFSEEKEITNWFMSDNDIVISVFSFFTQSPSLENIELLEDTVLYSMSYQSLQQHYQQFPQFNLHGRIITEQYYMLSEQRNFALKKQSAKQRYDLLLKQYPQILQKASLGHIASYLGITQETLSRIRKQK
jgi:CRP-like cAMP-binding protein